MPLAQGEVPEKIRLLNTAWRMRLRTGFAMSDVFRVKKWLSSLAFLLLCSSAFAQLQEVTSGVAYELIGTYDVARLNQILTQELKEFSDFPVSYPPAKYGVKLYRINYPSVIPEQENRPTVASGLLAVPEREAREMPVISYQHGSVFPKNEVPSHPDESMETRLMLAQFAGQGYLVVAADYFGKGESQEKDSYLVKASTQQACLDHLKACQAVSTHLKLTWGPLFLSGWSQGGWATLVFLKKLEEVGIPVKAAATASAPTDLFAMINGWIHAPTDHDASFLPALMALQINAYAEYHRLPGLDESAFRPEYRQTARKLYLNEMTWAQASPLLPKTLSELLREDFIAAGSVGNARYWQILQDSQAYRWRSITPLRTYYGQADEVTSPYIATLPVGFQKATGGAETTGVDAGVKANHRGTFLYAVADQKKWFDEMLRDKSEN